MPNLAVKVGRNEKCFCGSGKKYKKCCRLKEVPHAIVSSEAVGTIKMSEILLEFAEELLELAQTSKEIEQSLILAITAWNLSFLKTSEHKNHIEKFFQVMKVGEQERPLLTNIIEELIHKRRQDYTWIDRMIISYEIIKKGKIFNLRVISKFDVSDKELI